MGGVRSAWDAALEAALREPTGHVGRAGADPRPARDLSAVRRRRARDHARHAGRLRAVSVPRPDGRIPDPPERDRASPTSRPAAARCPRSSCLDRGASPRPPRARASPARSGETSPKPLRGGGGPDPPSPSLAGAPSAPAPRLRRALSFCVRQNETNSLGASERITCWQGSRVSFVWGTAA